MATVKSFKADFSSVSPSVQLKLHTSLENFHRVQMQVLKSYSQHASDKQQQVAQIRFLSYFHIFSLIYILIIVV